MALSRGWTGKRSWPRWPQLDRYGVDLTRQLPPERSEPFVPRLGLQERLAAALMRRDGASAALIGPRGSGRRTALRELAHQVANGRVPDGLRDRQVYEVDATRLLTGTRYRGELEERVAKLAQEVRAGRHRLIVYLLHAPLLIDYEQGAPTTGVALRQLLASGGWVLTCDDREWSTIVARLPGWDGLLQVVAMADWTDDDATAAAAIHVAGLSTHHGVRYADDTTLLAVGLARRYVQSRALPGAALDLLDEAAALVRVHGGTDVRRADVLSAVAGRTGLPLQGLDVTVPGPETAHTTQWQQIEASLSRRVLGQQPAVAAVAAGLRRARAGLSDPRRPLASILCLGPTGVGKTELARTVADFLFGDETALVRVDMSEYMERHAVARLLGAPPGYVGFELPGQLTDPVRRRPFTVVLLDEIEKAHPDILNILLQLLEDGRLTDGHGRTIDFRHTVILLTSNVGSVEARQVAAPTVDLWRDLAWRLLRPELLNRLDDISVFAPLTPEVMEDVVDLQFERVAKRFEPWQIRLRLLPQARRALAEGGYDADLGARPLRRLLEREIVDPLARELLAGRLSPGEEVIIDGDLGHFFDQLALVVSGGGPDTRGAAKKGA